MKTLLALLLAGTSSIVAAEVRMLPIPPTGGFGGGRVGLNVAFENLTDRTQELDLRTQILQASSSTVAPRGRPVAWKRLTLLPHQTIADQATVAFPVVRAETRFLVRFTHEDTALGTAEVWVYPSNILAALTTLLDGESLLLVDAPAWLNDALVSAKVDCVATTDPSNSRHGRIALVGTPSETGGSTAGTDLVWTLANAKTGVIWLKPVSASETAIQPAYQTFKVNSTTVVVAQSQTLTNLATDPWAQLRLVRMARLAAGQENLDLQKSIQTNP